MEVAFKFLIFSFMLTTLIRFCDAAPVEPPEIEPEPCLATDEDKPRSIGDLAAATEFDLILETLLLLRICVGSTILADPC